MKKVLLLLCLLVLSGCCAVQGERQGGGYLLMASTIGPIDAGIVEVLENAYEQETGTRVRHVGAGTGATLKIAQKGNADLVMVHAKSLEEKFVAEGYGTERIDLMYNDFVILGPASDPAGIKGLSSATEALSRIAAKGAPFISRGDKSGTHVAEMNLWQQANIEPRGAWYIVYAKGSAGNAATLKYANEKQAYTFVDRATCLALQKEITLAILTEKDQALLNFITLIPINPAKFPRAHHRDALAFVQWLTDPAKGQAIIADFGKDKYGSPMFFANSKAWRDSKGSTR